MLLFTTNPFYLIFFYFSYTPTFDFELLYYTSAQCFEKASWALYVFASFAGLSVVLLGVCLPLYFFNLHYKGLALIADYCRLTAVNTSPSVPAAPAAQEVKEIKEAPATEIKPE